jgi:hypothetical protein
MLAGMPETEAAYLQQLLNVVSKTKMVKIVRPEEILITELHNAIEEYLDNR